jgi:hypothetical protein
MKLLAFGLLVFSILCWIRLTQAIFDSQIIALYAPVPLTLYWVISGTIWGVFGLITTVSLWMKRTWSLWLIGIGTAFFVAWFWLDRAFVEQNPARWTNWIFTLIVQILISIFIYSTLIYLHPPKIDLSESGKL